MTTLQDANTGLGVAGYAAAADIYLGRGWRAPILLPCVAKKPPPKGVTGDDGTDPSYADIQAWKDDGWRQLTREGEIIARPDDGNTALRMPPDVVGIDVDCYGGKTGAAALAEAQLRWGTLPPGPSSTSRDDGSRIRFYRIPPGVELPTALAFDLDDGSRVGDIEIVQRRHRYAIVWPSFHRDTGEQYRWFAADGSVLDVPPSPDDLPELPAAWLAGLLTLTPTRNGTVNGADAPAAVSACLTEGNMSTRVVTRLDAALRDLNASRHDHTRNHVLTLLRCGKDGEPGVKPALKILGDAFVSAVAADRPGGAREAQREYRAFINGPNVPGLLGVASHPRRPETKTATLQANPQAVFFGFADNEAESGSAQPSPWGVLSGDAFILDQPKNLPAVWGTGSRILWPEGEGFMIAGSQGVGKTGIAGQLVRELLGLGTGQLFGLPVNGSGETILYLAMDRPRQIARSMARQFSADERHTLRDRLIIRPGPPPADLAKEPDLLARMATELGAGIVFIDSLKDAALGLSDDQVGAAYNRARQYLLAAGRQLCDLHHCTKRNATGGPPSSINDIYGSTWLTSGCGSVLLLSGDPGDPIIKLRHVKPAVDEIGPLTLAHDKNSGAFTARDELDLVVLADQDDGDGDEAAGVTAQQAAAAIFETDLPTKAQIEKARRKLDVLADAGQLWRRDGARGRGSAARWLPTGRAADE